MVEDVKEVFRRLQAGDEGAVATFEEMMDHPTAGPKLVEWYGNLAARTRDLAVDVVAQESLTIKAATPRKLAALRAELEGPDPSPIERLLADRAVFCWLILWEYEYVLAAKSGGLTPVSSAFHHRRIDAAHRRYLSSLRTLATVRKLAGPKVQAHAAPHHHHEAEATAPCSCHEGTELPAFAERFGRLK